MGKSEVQKIKNKLRMRKYRIAQSKDIPNKRELEAKLRRERLEKTEQDNQAAYIENILLKYTKVESPFLSGNEGLLCSRFGCGKILSLIEKLSGSTCTEHMTITRKPFA